jgi:release factor glutamine methyltransferase
MEAPRTAGEMLARAKEFLARKGVEPARLDAELLVAHVLGLTRLALYLQLDRPVNEGEIAAARELLVRRGKREPVAYILGAREFYGRRFAVDRRVLIPRPETELVVDIARERAKERGGSLARFADVGTGSGCLAVTLALELPGSRGVAVDVSADALEVARANAKSLGAEIELVHGDGPEALFDRAPFDLVVSNPPYVDPRERGSLAPEVADHEPAGALFTPDADPEHWSRRLSDAAPRLLAPDGRMLIELGIGQAEGALRIARERGLEARTHRDYEGVERVLELSR